jgi:hypothetical protein
MDRSRDDMADMSHLLEHIIETQRVGRVIESVPATSQTRVKAVLIEWDMIQTIVARVKLKAFEVTLTRPE